MTDASGLQSFIARLRTRTVAAPGFEARVMERVHGGSGPARARRGLMALAVAAALAAVAVGLARHRAGPAGAALLRTEFVLEAPTASAVAVVGDFNDWDRARTPLHRDRSGRWRAEVPLRGGVYQYAFLVDGSRWMPDPARPGLRDSDFGEAISFVAVE